MRVLEIPCMPFFLLLGLCYGDGELLVVLLLFLRPLFASGCLRLLFFV